jgi:hypothetical protein
LAHTLISVITIEPDLQRSALLDDPLDDGTSQRARADPGIEDPISVPEWAELPRHEARYGGRGKELTGFFATCVSSSAQYSLAELKAMLYKIN